MKWEYKVLRAYLDMSEEGIEEKKLNELGEEGWELLRIEYIDSNCYLIFKRNKSLNILI